VCDPDQGLPTGDHQSEPSRTATYWLSIGRNIGAEPMDHALWGEFRTALVHALTDRGATIITTVDGQSSWNDQPEATYLVLVTDWPTGRRADALQRRLEHLASIYGQEAIGLVGGPGETLVYAR
jgi:hypothetical protein